MRITVHHMSDDPPRRRSRGTTERRGFSILELMVVMIVMGIIAAMAVPRLNYESYRADGAMRTVRTVLQGAQRNAIMRQTNVVVAFDVTGKRMGILEDTNNNCTQDTGERFTQRPLEEGAKFSLPPAGYGGSAPSSPIDATGLCTLAGMPALEFLRDGASSTDVNVYMTSSRGTTTDFRLVRVTKATGRTESFRYNGSAWMRKN